MQGKGITLMWQDVRISYRAAQSQFCAVLFYGRSTAKLLKTMQSCDKFKLIKIIRKHFQYPLIGLCHLFATQLWWRCVIDHYFLPQIYKIQDSNSLYVGLPHFANMLWNGRWVDCYVDLVLWISDHGEDAHNARNLVRTIRHNCRDLYRGTR